MASVRIPALRHVSRCGISAPRPINQRRWAQVHDVRFLATTRPAQDIADKYREKLEQKAKQEGFKDAEELKTAYSDKIREAREKSRVEFPIPQAPNTPVAQPNRGPLPPGGQSQNGGASTTSVDQEVPQAPETQLSHPGKDGGGAEAPASKTADAARRVSSGSKAPAIKGLDDIINLEKSRNLPERELTAIWRLRHASSPQNLCAVVPAATYRAMEEAARVSPQFILPVPHEGQGAEIHFLQWTFDAPSRTSTVLFTQLAEFKMRGDFAQPHTTVTHHLDLLDERGLVMMQGQVVDGRGVQPEQARWLVMCLQRFYGAWESGAGADELTGERRERAQERRNLLGWFASGDERFTVEKLLEEAERIG